MAPHLAQLTVRDMSAVLDDVACELRPPLSAEEALMCPILPAASGSLERAHRAD